MASSTLARQSAMISLRCGNELASASECRLTAVMCCLHNRGRSLDTACHATSIADFATSCKYTGTPSAVAGFGIATGLDKHAQMWAVAVDNRLGEPNCTNNRTDLLAALECIRQLARNHKQPFLPCSALPQAWVVASASDYLVKNYTRNLAKWEAKGWKKWRGGQPANLDLWIRLRDMIVKHEDEYGIRIGFYKVKKQDVLARVTRLAKTAVETAENRRTPLAAIAYYVGALSLRGSDMDPPKKSKSADELSIVVLRM